MRAAPWTAAVSPDCEPAFNALKLRELYLANREAIDRYLEVQEQDYDAKREAARATDPMFYQKLSDAKRQTPLVR